MVVDDLFSTVSSVETRANEPPDNWDQLCLENMTFIPVEADPDVSDAALTFDWTTPEDRNFAERTTTRQDVIRCSNQPAAPAAILPALVPSLSPPLTSTSGSTSRQHPSAFPSSHPDNPDALPSPIPQPPMLVPAPVPVTQPSVASPTNGSNRINKGTFSIMRCIDEAFLSSTGFMKHDSAGHDAALAYMAELHTCSDTGVMDIIDPRVYASKVQSMMSIFQSDEWTRCH